MKALSFLAVVLALGLTFGATDAEAKRMGGGKSIGVQKSAPAKSPEAAPNQAQNSSAAASKQAAAPAAAAQPQKRSWMGPIAGLAAGLGLAALASHLGFGQGLANFLMIALLIMVVIAIIGFFMRRKAAAQSPALAGAGGDTRYNSSVADYDAPVERSNATPLVGSAVADGAQATRNIPAEFDVDSFVRNAKVNFIRLQAANDAGNLEDIREFTTPEIFAEIKMNLAERGGVAQETDVVTIEADVLEVVEEPTRYMVSVRFTGLLREEKDAPAAPIDEIWHLIKPREGKGGWLLAGIQQMQ